MKEHDDKRDMGGNRGSNFGMGKVTSGSHGDCSEGDLKQGYKNMGKVPLKESGKVKK